MAYLYLDCTNDDEFDVDCDGISKSPFTAQETRFTIESRRYVVCPKCGETNNDYTPDLNIDKDTIDCDSCNSEFSLEIEIVPKYRSYK